MQRSYKNDDKVVINYLIISYLWLKSIAKEIDANYPKKIFKGSVHEIKLNTPFWAIFFAQELNVGRVL